MHSLDSQDRVDAGRENVLPGAKKERFLGFKLSGKIADTNICGLPWAINRRASNGLQQHLQASPWTTKMGTGKKEKTRKEKQGKVGDGMANVKVKGENFYRTGKQAKTLGMFKDGKAQRNASGKVTKAASFQSRDQPKARVEPNRKW